MPELGAGGCESLRPNESRLRGLQTTTGRHHRWVWGLCHLPASCHSLQTLGEKPWESEAFSGSLPSTWEEHPLTAAPPRVSLRLQPPGGRKVSLCGPYCVQPACAFPAAEGDCWAPCPVLEGRLHDTQAEGGALQSRPALAREGLSPLAGSRPPHSPRPDLRTTAPAPRSQAALLKEVPFSKRLSTLGNRQVCWRGRMGSLGAGHAGGT